MKPTITLVHLEDDSADAELVARAVHASFSCAIRHVTSEAGFRAAIAEGPDVILADAHLPGFDGLTAQRIATEQCPDVPFIYVTGTLGEEQAVERVTTGALDYVLKHRLSRLPEAITRALRITEDRRGRRIAEEALRRLNAELEQRVEERTRELQRAQAQAEDANKAKSEFLSRMSHDLRTPLNAILGFAQLLQVEALSDENQESVSQIVNGGRHLLDLINEVLDISRIETGYLSLSLEPVSIPEVLHRVSSLVRPLADSRGLSLVIELAHSSGAPYVVADGQRLNQVLVNLLANAVKYNREGGDIRLTCTENNGRLQVSITDSGLGIHPLKLGRIFIPFERLGAEQSGIEGTGLGLALSKRLVEAMAGSMGVESEVGRGSRFWIDLPLSAAPSLIQDDQADEPLEESQQAQGLLLYVEDNVDNVRLMRRLVSRRPNVELLHACDGATALALITSRKPDMVFLDLHLPDMSGQEVLQRILNNVETRRIPVAILTADATAVQRRALLAAGATSYLTKPFSLSKILHLLDTSLAPRQSTNGQRDSKTISEKTG